MSLKNLLIKSFNEIKAELSKAKKLSNEEVDKFKNLYGISTINGEIYSNKYNIILTSKDDYDSIKYIIGPENHVLQFNIEEYGYSMFVFRKLNDAVLEEYF